MRQPQLVAEKMESRVSTPRQTSLRLANALWFARTQVAARPRRLALTARLLIDTRLSLRKHLAVRARELAIHFRGEIGCVDCCCDNRPREAVRIHPSG